MAPETKVLKDLKACMKSANTPAARAVCEAAFGKDPVTSTNGGKVFSTPDGNAVFVASDGTVFGGKVA